MIGLDLDLDMEKRWSERKTLSVGVDIYQQGELLQSCFSQDIGLGGTFLGTGTALPLYQDTDVASDTNLQDLVEFMYTNFKLKSRISTVGWSRHNTQLQALHCYQPSMYNRVRYIDSLILMASITL